MSDDDVIRRGDVLALPVLVIPYDEENAAALRAVDRYRDAIAALPADDRVAKLVEACFPLSNMHIMDDAAPDDAVCVISAKTIKGIRAALAAWNTRADLIAAREAAARREGWNAALEAAAEALRQEFYLHNRSPSLPNTGEVAAAIILAMKETDQ
jgi:hypothetical protein